MYLQQEIQCRVIDLAKSVLLRNASVKTLAQFHRAA